MPEEILSGQDIICLAVLPWHGPWKAYHQLMSRFAEANRVLCAGPPQSLREAVHGLRARAPRLPIVEHIGASLYLYNEPRLLARSRMSPLYTWTTERLRLAHLRRIARQLGFTSPVLWIFNPLLTDTVGSFQEKLVVYHVVDNYVEYLPVEATEKRAIVAECEERMLRQAGVVIAVSRSLQRKCLRINPNSYLIPNGVDYSRFEEAASSTDRPAGILQIPRPIIGYVGVIQPSLDLALMREIALRRRSWSVVLVGPEDLGSDRLAFDALLNEPNVFYLGPKAVDEVATYINSCDVCLMPDHVDVGGADVDSIKLYEYLACGRPVVSTNTLSAQRFSSLIYVAHDSAEFIRCIERALNEGDGLRRTRMAFARESSWNARLRMLSAVLRGHLDGDSSPSSEFGSPAHFSSGGVAPR